MSRVPLGFLSPNRDNNRENTEAKHKQWENKCSDGNSIKENECSTPVKRPGKAPSRRKQRRAKCPWSENSPSTELPIKCQQRKWDERKADKTDLGSRLNDVSAILDILETWISRMMEDVPVTLRQLDQCNDIDPDRRVDSLKEKKKSMGADPMTTGSSEQVSQSSSFYLHLEKQEIGKYEASLLQSVQKGRVGQVEQLLNSDRTISENEIKEAVAWSLEQEHYKISWLLLQDMCRLLVAAEGDNCVEAFPAFRKGHCWEPLFVVLSKLNYQGEWDSFMGFHVYKRRYDFVSPEAALVMNSDMVQNNPLTFDDFKCAKHAINSARLHERHSKITVINACPYRSKRMGEMLEKGLCIVVHCWIKGFIPFNEEPFPEEIKGIPVDVREGYFQVGGKTRTPRPRFHYRSSDSNQSLSDDTHSPTFTLDDSGVSSSSQTSRSTASSNSPCNEDMSILYKRNVMSPSATNMDQDVFMGSGADGTMVDKFQAMDLELHTGPKSKDFNQPLLIGTCIGPSGGEGSGTLGGFVRLKNGGVGALTCAHVTQGRKLMSQPAEAELGNASSSKRCLFGSVVETMFDNGSLDGTGIDAAIIEIKCRQPVNGAFVWSRQEQLTFADSSVDLSEHPGLGFNQNSQPRFTKGKILRLEDLTPRKRHTSVIKQGAETGLTCGKLYLNGLYVRISNREMRLPNSNQTIEFFNQMEVISVQGTSRQFFDLGDSGSLVFMPLNGSELYCFGLCVGCTSYGSCVVTPIEEIFNKSDIAVKFIDYSDTWPPRFNPKEAPHKCGKGRGRDWANLQ